MTPTISYYGRAIEVLEIDGYTVEFCKWLSGFRLISVNKRKPETLSNDQFSYYLNMIEKHI